MGLGPTGIVSVRQANKSKICLNLVGRLFQKRVVLFFMADGGGAPVARVNDGLVWKSKKPGSYAGQKGIVVAAGKICPANALPEQDVAADYKILGFAVKTNASGRMSRRE